MFITTAEVGHCVLCKEEIGFVLECCVELPGDLSGALDVQAWSSERFFSADPQASKDRHAFIVALANAE